MPRMLKQVLGRILTPEEIAQVYSAFDQIGDIIIIKIPNELMPRKTLIANAILANVKTAKAVFAQVSPVRGDFRVRDLEFIAGENRTITEHKEHSCRFKVDVSKTYFSPRLSTERQRIAEMIKDNETIVNMFAGVGTYSIVMAKANKTCIVYSIDSNSAASELGSTNAKLNKVQDQVVSICGDAGEVIMNRLVGKADRVLMPLPEKAKEFIDYAVSALKDRGIVHYFAHIKADNKSEVLKLALRESDNAFANYDHQILGIRVVREVGPRIYQIVADVLVVH